MATVKPIQVLFTSCPRFSAGVFLSVSIMSLLIISVSLPSFRLLQTELRFDVGRILARDNDLLTVFQGGDDPAVDVGLEGGDRAEVDDATFRDAQEVAVRQALLHLVKAQARFENRVGRINERVLRPTR